jgi:hypothetical protein
LGAQRGQADREVTRPVPRWDDDRDH